MRLLRPTSYKKGIFASVVLNIGAKGLGFVNSMAIAYFFGAQSKTDIYFYCYATIALISAFIGSLDNSVIIPESARIREQEGEKNAKYFLNYFFYFYLAIGLLVILILFIDPVSIVRVLSNFDLASLEANRNLVLWFIPICVLMLLTQYLANILSSYKFFTIPVVAGIINNLFSVGFLLSFHHSLDIKSIVLGLIAGYLGNIFILILIMKRQLDWSFAFKKISFNDRLKKNIRYAFLGNITSLLAGYAPFYILSNFNAGVVTAFNYARNLSDIPNQMITTQFSTVSGIKFNELAARNSIGELNSLFVDTTRFLFFLLAPLCGIFILFAEPIVAFFFQRGTFDKAAVAQTAFMLKFLSFSLLYFVVNTMVSRLFMSTQKLKEAFWYQVYMNIILIVIILLASYRFGINGYLAGTVFYQLVVIVFTYWLMKRYFSFINYRLVIKGISATLLLNLVLVTGFGFVLKNLTPNFFMAFIGAGLYFFFVILVNRWLQLDRISNELIDQFIRKITGRAFPVFSKTKI